MHHDGFPYPTTERSVFYGHASTYYFPLSVPVVHNVRLRRLRVLNPLRRRFARPGPLRASGRLSLLFCCLRDVGLMAYLHLFPIVSCVADKTFSLSRGSHVPSSPASSFVPDEELVLWLSGVFFPQDQVVLEASFSCVSESARASFPRAKSTRPKLFP